MQTKGNKKFLYILLPIVAVVISFVSILGIVWSANRPDDFSSIIGAEELETILSTENVEEETQEVKNYYIKGCTFEGTNTHLNVIKGTSYTIEDCEFSGSSVNTIIVKSGATLVLDNTKITNCTATAIKNEGTLTIQNGSEVSGINAGNVNGGAIINTGTLNIDNSNISNNTAIGDGGAILNTGSLVINGGKFEGNSGANGAAVHTSGGQIKVINTNFNNNVSSKGGGALYITSGYSKNISIENANFTGNSSKLQGSAIIIESCRDQSNNVSNYVYISGNFSENKTDTSVDGGSIFVSSSDVNFQGNVENCVAANGGAVYLSYSNVIIKSNSTFTGNEGTQYAGAIYCFTSTLDIEDNVTFESNKSIVGGGMFISRSTLNMSNSTLTQNISTDIGGGICANSNSTLNISGGNISKNSATNNGGGICCFDTNVNLTNAVNISENCSTNGGGVYCYGILNASEDSIFNSNTASGGIGGGIYVSQLLDKIPQFTNNKTVNANGTATNLGNNIYCNITSISLNKQEDVAKLDFIKFDDEENVIIKCLEINITTALTLDKKVPYGTRFTINANDVVFNNVKVSNVVGNPGITLNSGFSLTLNNCEVSNCTFSGIENYGTLNINSSTISGNSSTNTDGTGGTGGGIRNNGTLTISDNSSISENSAPYGGGIYNTGTLTISSNSSISENSANIGGGIFNTNSGTLTISGNSSISGNSAKYSGGGIDNSGTLTISEDVTLSSNTAKSWGGAIYTTKPIYVLPQFENNKTVDSNGQTTNRGNNIYCTIPSITLSNQSDISQLDIFNYNDGADYVIECPGINVNITLTLDNKVTYGTIFIINANDVVFNNVKVSNVVDKSAITLNSGFSLTLNNCEVSNCTGGGIVNSGTLNINSSTISGNSTTGSGGGINNRGTLTISEDVTLNSNTAKEKGGGIANIGTLTISEDVTLNSNTTKGLGGAIYTSEIIDVSPQFENNKTVDSNGQTTNRGNNIYYDIDNIQMNDQNIDTVFTFINSGDNSDIIVVCRYIKIISTLTLENKEITSGPFIDVSAYDVVFNNVKVSNVVGYPGITLHSGSLTLNNCEVSNCINRGIENYGTLNINSSTISGNSITGGSGGGIYNYSTLNINSSTISGNSTTGSGGGIDNNGTLIIYGNSSISENSAKSENSANYGGGIYNDGTLTISENTIISKNSATRGGGIYNYDKLTLNSCTISDNTATENGGGILNNGSDISIEGLLTLSGNSAVAGGGIYNLKYFILQNVILENNTATETGGGIHCAANIKFVSGTLTGNRAEVGGAIYSNKSRITIGEDVIFNSNSAGIGGAITVQSANDSSNPIYIYGKFYNNTATTYGGAIVLERSYTEFAGEIYGGVDEESMPESVNAASAGGIYVMSGGYFEMNENAIIKNCKVTEYGGAVYCNNTEMSIYGNSLIQSNSANIGGGLFISGSVLGMFDYSKILSNTSTDIGGGICANGESLLFIPSGEITGNITGTHGGAIFQDTGHLIIGHYPDDEIVKNVTIKDNSASKEGGAIKINSANTVLISNFVTISGNSAGEFCGGITMSSCTFSDNTLDDIGLNIEELGVTKSIEIGANFYDNVSSNTCGAVSVYNGDLYFLGSIYGGTDETTLPTSSNAIRGGAIYMGGSSRLTLTNDALIKNCKATDYGGAIFAEVGSNVVMNNGTSIEYCQANYGGAIFLSSSALTVDGNAKMKSNSATNNGGAIFLNNNSEIYINNGVFESNTALNGGAIHDELTTTFNITYAEFLSCSASNTGGAIYAKNLNMTNGKFENCSALRGGAISTAGINNISATFINNIASEYGGSVYSSSGSTLNLSGNFSSTLSSANAQVGGAIFVVGKTSNSEVSNVTINNSTFNGLIASQSGGAIANTGVLTILNSTFENCGALYGGAITNALSIYQQNIISYPKIPANLYMSGVKIEDTCRASIDYSTDSGVTDINKSHGILNVGNLYMTGENDIDADICIAYLDCSLIGSAQGNFELSGISEYKNNLNETDSDDTNNKLKVSYVDTKLNISDITNVSIGDIVIDNINGTTSKGNEPMSDAVNHEYV